MKAYLTGWSRTHLQVLAIGAALIVVGGGIAFAQSPTPAPSRTPPPIASSPATPGDTPAVPAPPPMRTLLLTDDEAQNLILMINESVKARGLDWAEVASAMARKIQAAPKK